MNNKFKLVGLILIFFGIIIGASLLYSNLSGGISGDQLVVNENSDYHDHDHEHDHDHDHENENDDNHNHDHDHEDHTHDEETSEGELQIAPDIKIYDESGNEVLLSSYFGKPIVMNFWASWCGPCQSEMPDFEEAYLSQGNDIQFLMINLTDGSRETIEKAASFIEEHGYTFPVLFDTSSDAAIKYSVSSIPTTYFINSEGYLVAQAMGAIDSSTLQKGIDLIK